uniref:G-protein coupled receptors family 2 profile 1 domain-containing protein n=1 Tax=Heliothis virescens TaxID=7102 RepID=A0A2A4IZC6_HELVI
MEIMQERHLIFNFVYCATWISILHGTQVGAHLKDVLNPVNADFDVWHQRDTRVAIRANDLLACERPNIYICEEPPETVPPDARKTCNYRNVRYHEQVFRWVAGRGCLLYTPDFLYVAGSNTINLNAGCFYGNWFAPCLEIAKEDGSCGCYPFDPGLEEVAAAVHEALIPAAHGRWERCFYAASDCCSHYMPDIINVSDTNQCEATFDGWTCWQEAVGGVLATEVCSEFAYSNTGPSCNHYSSKQCHSNATWELQTDYSTCSITPRLLAGTSSIWRAVHLHHRLPTAVFIFCFYKD